MKTDRQIEILKKAILILEADEIYVRGICDILRNFKDAFLISTVEFGEMKVLLVENKPTLNNEFRSFTLNEFWIVGGYSIDTSFWWNTIFRSPETRQIRIDYLKQLIAKLK
jgi:hypothetical protein